MSLVEKNGLAIFDVENPEARGSIKSFNANNAMHEVNDVKIGMVCRQRFRLRRRRLPTALMSCKLFLPGMTPLTSPVSRRGPTPKLIATARTRGAALAISKGIDRDRRR